MNKQFIGYARVSSREQNEDRQIIALSEYGVPLKAIFCDKIIGNNFERKNYKCILKKLKKGNILVIKSIDRLGRNYKEVINQWRYITQDKGADIIVLYMSLLDTTQHKDLLGTFISDMVLQLLSYVSENERLNIRQRQSEGIAAAKAKGVRFGRPQKYQGEKYEDIFIKYEHNEIKAQQAISQIVCKERTFYRMLSEWRKKNKTNALKK